MTSARTPAHRGPADPLVVELCGLPGAGKTTLALGIVESLRGLKVSASVADAGVSAAEPWARRVPRKIGMVARTVGHDPLGEARAAVLIGAGQEQLRDRLAVTTHWWVRKHLLTTARRASGVVVVEEGLVQALWTAALRQRSRSLSRLVALAASSERADLVVHVDAPVDVTLQRLRARSSRHSRMQNLAHAEQDTAMRTGDALLRSLLDEWSRQGLGEVLQVGNGSSLLSAEGGWSVLLHRIAQ